MAKTIPNGAYKTEGSAMRMAHRNYRGDAATFYLYETQYGWGWFASNSAIADEWKKTGRWFEVQGESRLVVTGPHQFEYGGL